MVFRIHALTGAALEENQRKNGSMGASATGRSYFKGPERRHLQQEVGRNVESGSTIQASP